MKVIQGSLLSIVVASSLFGGGWEDILKGSNADGQLIDDGGSHTVTLYNSSFTYTVNNNDGIAGNFSDTDTATVTLVSNGKTITSGTTPLTNDQLKSWATTNATSIIESIFGGDPASSLGGQNSAITTTEGIINTLSTISAQTTKKVKEDINQFNSQTIMNSETASIKDKNKTIDGSSGIFAYANQMQSGNSWGMIINYKTTKADDTMESKTATLSLTPFYKIENPIDKQLNIPVLLSLSGNLVYIESSIFPDGGGYLEYGAGVGILPTYQLNDSLMLTSTLGYQYLKKTIPSSYVPEDASWVADAINTLKPLQILNYGIGVEYKVVTNFKLNGNILQMQHLETSNIEEGRESATYYSLSGTYDFKKWAINLGYKTVQGVQDYSEDTYMASLKYKW
jgi:hypothetical protein